MTGMVNKQHTDEICKSKREAVSREHKMKITVFNGSPRGKDGVTDIMVTSFLEGAEEAGADVGKIYLAEENIEQCKGCFSCWYKSPGKCCINDGMGKLIDQFLRSQIVCFATPVYNNNMTGYLKIFTERLLPIFESYFKFKNMQEFYHEYRREKYPAYMVIANSGFPGENNFNALKMLFSQYSPIAEIYLKAAWILKLSDSGLTNKIKNYKEHLKNAGTEIVKYSRVTTETMDRLKEPILEDEELTRLHNRLCDVYLREAYNTSN